MTEILLKLALNPKQTNKLTNFIWQTFHQHLLEDFFFILTGLIYAHNKFSGFEDISYFNENTYALSQYVT